MRKAPLKKVGFLIFTLLTTPLLSEWKIQNSKERVGSLWLHYKDPSPYQWTTAELIPHQDTPRLIFNLHLCPILTDNQEIPLEATSQDIKKKLKGYLLSGGEKIVIDEDDCNWIIDQQLEGNEIKITFDRYNLTLKPHNFAKLWKQLRPLR